MVVNDGLSWRNGIEKDNGEKEDKAFFRKRKERDQHKKNVWYPFLFFLILFFVWLLRISQFSWKISDYVALFFYCWTGLLYFFSFLFFFLGWFFIFVDALLLKLRISQWFFIVVNCFVDTSLLKLICLQIIFLNNKALLLHFPLLYQNMNTFGVWERER